MTLVEVIAGLALMASTLTAVLVVRGQCVRQGRDLERHREAIDTADRLLATWWQDVSTFPRSGSGPIPGSTSLEWRTSRQRNPAVEALDGEVVRLVVAHEGEGAPLTWVEVVLPPDVKHETSVHPH